MLFQIGDKVIHAVHGIGDIIEIENKTIHDQDVSCFVVRTQALTIWVPADERDQHSLRAPTMSNDFENLFAILQGPNEPLPEDRIERKKLLHGLLNDGKLMSIGRVVRDLSSFSHERKLSEEDKSILERAENTLLVEWGYSLSVSMPQARSKMKKLLDSQTGNSSDSIN